MHAEVFPEPTRPEDGDSGIEAPLRDHEPLRVGNLPRLDRVMRFANDDGWFLIRVAIGHGGSSPLPRFLRGPGSNQTRHMPKRACHR